MRLYWPDVLSLLQEVAPRTWSNDWKLLQHHFPDLKCVFITTSLLLHVPCGGKLMIILKGGSKGIRH